MATFAPKLDLIRTVDALKTNPLTRKPIGQGQHIYAYCNIRTNQVIYSLTQILRPHRNLRQLPDAGNNTKPPKLRKDLWRPLWTLTLPTGFEGEAQGLQAWTRLNALRYMHELYWRPPKELARNYSEQEMEKLQERLDDRGGSKRNNVYDLIKREKKKMRLRNVMDQKANSVADLAAVLVEQEGMSDVGEGQYEMGEIQKMMSLQKEAESGGLEEIESKIVELEGKIKELVKETPVDPKGVDTKTIRALRGARYRARKLLRDTQQRKEEMEHAMLTMNLAKPEFKKEQFSLKGLLERLQGLQDQRTAIADEQDTARRPIADVKSSSSQLEKLQTEFTTAGEPIPEASIEQPSEPKAETQATRSREEDTVSALESQLGNGISQRIEEIEGEEEKLIQQVWAHRSIKFLTQVHEAQELSNRKHDEASATSRRRKEQLPPPLMPRMESVRTAREVLLGGDAVETVEAGRERLQALEDMLKAAEARLLEPEVQEEEDAELMSSGAHDAEELSPQGQEAGALTLEERSSLETDVKVWKHMITAYLLTGCTLAVKQPNTSEIYHIGSSTITSTSSSQDHPTPIYLIPTVPKASFSMAGVKVTWQNILDAEFAPAWPGSVQHEWMGITRHAAPKPGMLPKMTAQEYFESKRKVRVEEEKVRGDVVKSVASTIIRRLIGGSPLAPKRERKPSPVETKVPSVGDMGKERIAELD